MAIKGSLKEASLPDVLQLLALGQKTGCLSIADRSNFGYIYFDKGRIAYASIVNRRDRLGDILVKHEKITQEQLDAAIHRQSKERDKKLGEILVLQSVLTQQELERYMRMQIEESVYYLFTWTQGTFNFEGDVRPEQQDFLVSINPESLLLEGARRVDEWGLIEKKIPSFDLIFVVDRDRLAISDAKLTEVQERLLPLLDGSRDVNQVIEDSGMGEFEVGKALYGLVTAGFLHRAGRTASAEDVKMTDARVEEHRNLGIAFYKTGMLDEAAREFRRVAELRGSDANAHFFIGLVALKQARWREAMEALRLAAEKGGSRPAVLHNLGLAYEQLGRLEDAEAAYSEAATRARTDPRVYVAWGVVALKQGDLASAAGRLDRAKELFAGKIPPIWFWARSLAAAAAGDFETAEQVAVQAVAAHARHRAVPGAGRRRVLQARQHRLQAERPGAGQHAVASRPRAESEARTRESESGHPEHVVVSKAPPERAFDALTEKISRERGVSCGSYKDKCLKRRIAVRMRARGVHTYEDYATVLDQDAHEYQELLDALTINVTKFFRNPETWTAIRPYLERLAQQRSSLRVWSAGCSSGEEPYTIAVLLAEIRAGGFIDATDVDRLSLERTRQAKYPNTAFSEMRARPRSDPSPTPAPTVRSHRVPQRGHLLRASGAGAAVSGVRGRAGAGRRAVARQG